MTEASGLIAIDPVAGDGGIGSVGWALPYAGGGAQARGQRPPGVALCDR